MNSRIPMWMWAVINRTGVLVVAFPDRQTGIE